MTAFYLLVMICAPNWGCRYVDAPDVGPFPTEIACIEAGIAYVRESERYNGLRCEERPR